jgi:hypothetical protein
LAALPIRGRSQFISAGDVTKGSADGKWEPVFFEAVVFHTACLVQEKLMKRAASPALQIRHPEGKNWCVAAGWADGRIEDIASFKSEADANAWITSHFQAWLESRQSSRANEG